MTYVSVGEFYSNRSILITGGTGFIGKVLIEKLLRSCPNLAKIYLLVRPKYGKNATSRIEHITSQKIFDRIKAENPKSLEKIVAVESDLMCPNLGLSDSDITMLQKEISVIIHSAATVKFNEHLRKSIQMNVLATSKLLDIAEGMPNLAVFVHVSTAYSNCDLDYIQEKFYPFNADIKKIIETVDWMDDDMVDKITPGILGKKPNTYTFTKAMAENLILERQGKLPIVVVRPSIVTCAWKEPMPGWIDNFNTITGFFVSFNKGVLKTIWVKPNTKIDIVPVDMCVNLIISTGWHLALNKSQHIPIYSMTSVDSNPLNWTDFSEIIPLSSKYPLETFYRCPGGSIKTSKLINTICQYYDHYLPALILDIISKITRIQILPKGYTALKMYRKLDAAIGLLDFFYNQQFTFESNNHRQIAKSMSEEDSKEFNFRVEDINWSTYIENYTIGIKKYLMKEDMNNLPYARRNYKIRYVIGTLTQIFFMFCVWKIFFSSWIF